MKENTYKVRRNLTFLVVFCWGMLQVSGILSYALDGFERMDTQSDAPWKRYYPIDFC